MKVDSTLSHTETRSRVKALLRDRKITNRKLAHRLRVTDSLVSHWLAGRATSSRLAELVAKLIQ